MTSRARVLLILMLVRGSHGFIFPDFVRVFELFDAVQTSLDGPVMELTSNPDVSSLVLKPKVRIEDTTAEEWG